MAREHKLSSPTNPEAVPRKIAPGKRKLKIIGKELPDLETDEQFQATWKITKAKEVCHIVLDRLPVSNYEAWHCRDVPIADVKLSGNYIRQNHPRSADG